MKISVPSFIIPFLVFTACSGEVTEQAPPLDVKTELQNDTHSSTFTIINSQDSVIENGESIVKYKNGVIKMRGMVKDNKREGLWKSWYEDGKPWSETTFSAGKKNGRTTTWYENGNKRYEGEYTNDSESGKWIFWDVSGKEVEKQDYGNK